MKALPFGFSPLAIPCRLRYNPQDKIGYLVEVPTPWYLLENHKISMKFFKEV
jgi:hypothetical protein